MAALGAEKTALEASLAQPMPAAEIAEAGKRLKLLNDELGALEERWLALSEDLDALQTQISGG